MMRLSDWRKKAPLPEAVSKPVMAVVEALFVDLGVKSDTDCWVIWGEDPGMRYSILAPSLAGMASIAVRPMGGEEGPRATGKLTRWSKLNLSELSIDAAGGRRIVAVQVDSYVLKGVDDEADRICEFVRSLLAGVENRVAQPVVAPVVVAHGLAVAPIVPGRAGAEAVAPVTVAAEMVPVTARAGDEARAVRAARTPKVKAAAPPAAAPAAAPAEVPASEPAVAGPEEPAAALVAAAALPAGAPAAAPAAAPAHGSVARRPAKPKPEPASKGLRHPSGRPPEPVAVEPPAAEPVVAPVAVVPPTPEPSTPASAPAVPAPAAPRAAIAERPLPRREEWIKPHPIAEAGPQPKKRRWLP